ncbi:hypothetical protein HID58_021394, partial [Brassica napus]
ERKADRVEGSDVRPARERACRRRSPSIFHRVISTASLTRPLPIALSELWSGPYPLSLPPGVIRHQWKRCVWSNDASGWKMGVKLCLEGVSGDDVVELLSLGWYRWIDRWRWHRGFDCCGVPSWIEAVERESGASVWVARVSGLPFVG